jgi:hypothetical protein
MRRRRFWAILRLGEYVSITCVRLSVIFFVQPNKNQSNSYLKIQSEDTFQIYLMRYLLLIHYLIRGL